MILIQIGKFRPAIVGILGSFNSFKKAFNLKSQEFGKLFHKLTD